MMGHRALYVDGWKAVTRHTPGVAFDDDDWELYHVAEDRSECVDLAGEQPERLAEMVARWWEEAEAHGVLPLDDRTIELFAARFRDRAPSPIGATPTSRPSRPSPPRRARDRRSQLGPDATIERAAGAGGVLFATGTENRGVSVFVVDDRLVFDYNCFGDHHVATSTRPCRSARPPSASASVGSASGTEATLVIDGEDSGAVEVPFVMSMISSVGPRSASTTARRSATATSGRSPSRARSSASTSRCCQPRAADRRNGGAADGRSAMARQ